MLLISMRPTSKNAASKNISSAFAESRIADMALFVLPSIITRFALKSDYILSSKQLVCGFR
jgi:hypothetical protein